MSAMPFAARGGEIGSLESVARLCRQHSYAAVLRVASASVATTGAFALVSDITALAI